MTSVRLFAIMAIVNEREVNTMTQTYTSANTSINSKKLPAIYNKIDFKKAWEDGNHIIADYGCGKFNNAKDFVEDTGFKWLGYDKFNRSEEENQRFMDSIHFYTPDAMICSNVLNVIDSEEEIQRIADFIRHNSIYYFVTVYEGNRGGKGRVTKNDCYQRHEIIKEYLKYFPNAVVYKGVITNAPDLLK